MLRLSQQSVRPHSSLPYWGGAFSKPCPPPLLLGSLNRCHPAASLFLLSPEKGTLPPPRRHAEHRPSFPLIHPLATVPPSLTLLPTPAPTTLSHPYLGRLHISVVYYPHSLAGPCHPWSWLACLSLPANLPPRPLPEVASLRHRASYRYLKPMYPPLWV